MARAALVVLPESVSTVVPSVILGARAGLRSHFPDVQQLWISSTPANFLAGHWEPFSEELVLSRTPRSARTEPPPPQPLADGELTTALQPFLGAPFLFLGGREAAAACQKMSDLHFDGDAVHVPLCGGNTLNHTHHCIGYGSVLRSLANYISGEDLDNSGFYCGVKLIIIEGDTLGWLAPAAVLSSLVSAAPDTDQGLLVLTPQNWTSPSALVGAVQNALHSCGRATLVVSEGIDTTLFNTDGTGRESGNAERTGHRLASLLVSTASNFVDFRIRVHVHSPFRHAHQASPSDQNEAMWLSAEAIKSLSQGVHGQSLVLDSLEDRNQISPRLIPARLLTSGHRTPPPSDTHTLKGAQSFLEYAAPLAGFTLHQRGPNGKRTVTQVPRPFSESNSIEAP